MWVLVQAAILVGQAATVTLVLAQLQAVAQAEYGIQQDLVVLEAAVAVAEIQVQTAVDLEYQAAQVLQVKGFQADPEYVLTTTAKIHIMVVVVAEQVAQGLLVKMKTNNKPHTVVQELLLTYMAKSYTGVGVAQAALTSAMVAVVMVV